MPLPRRTLLVALVLLSIFTITIYRLVIYKPARSTGIVFLSGRIEGDDAAIAAKVSGRIREILVREGERVTKGQLIALLEDEQVRARLEQAEAGVAQAEARLRRSEHQIEVYKQMWQQSRLSVDQAKLDAEGRVKQAEAQLASAEAQLVQAETAYRQAQYDDERFSRLVASGDVPEQTARQAHTLLDSQRALVEATRKQVEAARGALIAVRATLSNPDIRSYQTRTIEAQMRQAESEVSAARAELERSKAQLMEARANLKDLEIRAPFNATVVVRSAEPGEVVAIGTPIVTLVNLEAVYLRGFVPEHEIGKVKLGQRARVYIDSAPSTPIEAEVSRVDPEASFTPENTYFREDRVKQVVGVKLLIKAGAGAAKPGMPADGEILTEGEWIESGRTR